MSRRLLTVAALLMLATATLWVAGAIGWLPGGTADSWSGLSLKGAILVFGAALLGRLSAPIFGLAKKGRCAVCGRPTERGHAYCPDHLRETVNVTRDRVRRAGPPRPRS
jgi:hypothetical protein